MSKRHSIFQPVCLAVILGLGIQVAVAFVVGWFANTSLQMMPSDRTYQTLQFLVDGTPIIQTSTSGSDGYGSQSSYSTLKGTPIDQTDLNFQALPAGLPGLPTQTAFQVRPSWSQRIVGFSAGGQPPVYWYFVHNGRRDGNGYFVGFDSKSKRRVGYIGRQGACSDQPNDGDRFPIDRYRVSDYLGRYPGITSVQNVGGGYAHVPAWDAPATDRSNMPYWKVYLLSRNRLLEVDLRARSVRTVMETDGMISIGVLRRRPPSREQQSEAKPLQEKRDLRQVAIRTAGDVIVLDPSDGERLVYAIPAEIGRRTMQLRHLSDETLLATVRGTLAEGVWPHDLYWIRPGGEVQRHERVVLQMSGGLIDVRVNSGLTGIVAPVPAAWAAGVLAIHPAQQVKSGEAPDYASALADSLARSWPGLLISFLLTALAVWLCIRHQRRYALPFTRTWVVVMLLFGFPAFLGYLFHRVWPARVDCPACGKAVPRDRGACPECHVPYPDPEPTGSEVFA